MKIRGRQPVLRLWTRAPSPLLTRTLRQRLHNGTAHSSSDASMASTSKVEAAEEWAGGFASHRQRQGAGADEGGQVVAAERSHRAGENQARWEQFRRGEADDEGERRAVQSDWRHYARLLQECATSKSLPEGRKVHDRMRRNQVKPDTYLSNMLISMYAKCGSIEEAYKVFQAMVDKDVVSWNAMISGFAMHGRGQEAVDHYFQMQRQGFTPNKNTFVSILSAVTSPAVFDFGSQLHRTITKAGLEADVTVGTALITMYNKCGNVELARKVFNEMRKPNVVSWTAMISGYAQQGESKEAFLLFNKLIRSGVEPNKISFVSILGACTKPTDLEKGEELHTYIKRAGLEQELLVGNALISMYARCGSLANSRRVFDNIPSRNLVSWNAMISGYGDAHVDDAFSLFKTMQQKKIQPDRFTYASLLAMCADLDRGKELHAQIIRTGWDSDVHVATALISMYTKCGSLERARKVFTNMPERNVVSWNAFIAACCRHGAAREAFDTFQQMRRQGDVTPDRVTFMTLLTACSSLDDGRFLHDKITRHRMLTNDVANALISMYGRCGSVADAREVFYRIRARDVGSWNAMMATFVQHGANEAAYELFQKYRRERGRCDKYTFINALLAIANLGDLDAGRKVHALIQKSGMGEDIQILTTLIGMYAKCGSLNDACSAFSSISERDLVCWNAMLAAYARSGHGEDALKLFQHMQLSRMKLDSATYTSALTACANLGALEQGSSIHYAQLKKNTDTRVGNALIEMYSKCGSLSSAVQVFKKMTKPDLHSWNALISALCRHGHASKALHCYERMLQAGFTPNKATFTSVLSSHGQLGEVEETFEFLESMKQKWNVEPVEEHYVCMVHALGQRGLLKEAQEFIEETSPAAALMWEALLVACRVHQNVELAETSAEHLLNAKIQASPAVCEQLLSVYAATGRWENVAVLKTTMEATAGMVVKKRCTMEMNSEIHTFETNPGEVDEKIQGLVNVLTGKGLLLDPQEIEVLLFSNSAELLAVAYALNHSPPGTPVRCVVDSRVSDLSHKLLKFVATIHGREIFVRDVHCFHNFRPGLVCSCSDYW